MSVLAFIARRLALALLVIVGVITVTFTVSNVVPNDPAQLYAGARARPEQLEAVRERLRLEDPLPRQFIRYVGNVLRGIWASRSRLGAPSART